MAVDWGEMLACEQCVATFGKPCLDLLGAGPEALPSRPRAVPHSGRKSRAEAAAKRAAPAKATAAKPRPAASSTSAGRRTARKTTSTADAWIALAERRRST